MPPFAKSEWGQVFKVQATSVTKLLHATAGGSAHATDCTSSRRARRRPKRRAARRHPSNASRCTASHSGSPNAVRFRRDT